MRGKYHIDNWCLLGVTLLQSVVLVISHGTHHHTGGEKPAGFHDNTVVRDTEYVVLIILVYHSNVRVMYL